jgi:hypothetical protein
MHIRFRLVMSAALVLALAAAAPPPPVAQPTVTVTDTRAAFEKFALTNPAYGEMFRALKQDYPAEFAKFVDTIAGDLDAHVADADMRAKGFAQMRAFMLAKLPLLAAAPDADLHVLSSLYADLMRTMQREDVALCSRFAVAGFGAADIIPPSVQQVLSRANALQIHAVRHAETAPVPARGQLGPADSQAWVAAIARVDSGAMPLLTDTAKLAAASDTDKCAAGVAVYAAAAALPEAQSARVIANLLLQSNRAH